MPDPVVQPDATGSPPLGDLLVERGVLARADLERAVALERERGGGLARILTDLGFVNPADLLETQASRLGIPFLRADEFPSEPPVEDRVPVDYMRRYRFLPLGGSPVLRVAVADPLDLETLGSIRSRTGMPVEVALAAESDILAGIDKLYGTVDGTELAQAEPVDIEQLRDMASEAPVIRYANSLVARALEERASDIHLEPFERDFRVRFRIDGVLEERRPPPRAMRSAVVSRLKLMAGLDIAERRLPQDGRIQIKVAGRDIDLRVATLPTLHGESLAIRLLDPTVAAAFDLASLGFDEDLLARLARLIASPHGLVLVTGPTGSGKTTTLHAVLKRVNSPVRKIVTIEDPVEYRVEGVSQIHVNPAVGLTFAAGLRHIVRQDPDVIMVGEIRDFETAEIAIRAAMTGHSVYSTLHTNDAASAVTRLADMGVESYLVASSLAAVLAQRLVRLLCPRCREPAGSADAPDGRCVPTWRPRGCEACRGQGYSGRIGIFELLEIDERARRIVARNGASGALLEAARRRGMRGLRADGWDKIERGLTSVEEVLRVTQGS
jgi:general secretion pathway protein E